jgi:pimeloyl-ACP methyl ester carboxylesterase
VTVSQALESWINAGSYRTLRGHHIRTRTAIAPGQDPLLLIHGYPTASYDWHRLWPALAERFSLYALDMLGFGLSAKPRNSTCSINLQAEARA